jgi:mycofactocin precursor
MADPTPPVEAGEPADDADAALVETELLIEAELLIEDVSIDGMCGVY